MDTVLVDYTSVRSCTVPLHEALRDTQIFIRVFSTLHPRHFDRWGSAAFSICFYCLEFIFVGCFFFNPVFGCGVTLWRV